MTCRWMDKDVLTEQYRDATNLKARIKLHKRFSTNPTDMHRWLFDQMVLPSRAGVLELGCGGGDLWSKNLDLLPPGLSVTLSDASPGMVQEAARRLGGRGHEFSFAVADAQAIPFEDASVDAVVAHFMLYHVPNRSRAFAEIARILRPGGVLYAATNGRTHMREAKELAVQAGLSCYDAESSGDAPGFNLENGREQLVDWFTDVQIHRRDDALEITEVEPLLAALLSSAEAQAVLGGLKDEEAARKIAQLRITLEEQLARYGAIHISKCSGVFVARKGNGSI